MPYALIASDCPTPIVDTTLKLLSAAENTTGINGPEVLKSVAQGTSSLSAKWNRNALSVELLGRRACGTYCILAGLTISAGAGLSLNVVKGQALIDGVVEISSDTTYSVPASSTVFVWLKKDGTLTHSITKTPPSGAKVYLGNCTTSGSAVTTVDFSGVLYSRGSIACRNTNDTGVPSDTPPSTLSFLTVTNGGTYLWTGAAYVNIYTTAQLTEVVQDIVSTLMSSGTAITWTYNDVSNTLQANVTYADIWTALGLQHLVVPTNTETITATKTLTLADTNRQALTASGASRDVRLPSNTGLTFGHNFRIMNVGASNNIVVKDNAGSVTICTLTPGQYCDINPTTDAGVPKWPASSTATSMGTAGSGGPS